MRPHISWKDIWNTIRKDRPQPAVVICISYFLFMVVYNSLAIAGINLPTFARLGLVPHLGILILSLAALSLMTFLMWAGSYLLILRQRKDENLCTWCGYPLQNLPIDEMNNGHRCPECGYNNPPNQPTDEPAP